MITPELDRLCGSCHHGGSFDPRIGYEWVFEVWNEVGPSERPPLGRVATRGVLDAISH